MTSDVTHIKREDDLVEFLEKEFNDVFSDGDSILVKLPGHPALLPSIDPHSRITLRAWTVSGADSAIARNTPEAWRRNTAIIGSKETPSQEQESASLLASRGSRRRRYRMVVVRAEPARLRRIDDADRDR